jgi:hypothetical protein
VELVLRPSAAGTLTHTAAVVANEDDPNPDNNAFTEVTDVLDAVVDLSLTLTGPAEGFYEDIGNYTVTVTNNGPSTATGAVLEFGPFLDRIDSPPASSPVQFPPEFLSASGLMIEGRREGQEDPTLGIGVWHIFWVNGLLPTLHAGESASVTFQKRFLYKRPLTHPNPFEVRVTAAEVDPNGSNDWAWTPIRIIPVTLQLGAPEYVVSESAGKLTFTVVRSGDPRAFNAGVQVLAVDGTARAGINYSPQWNNSSYFFQEGQLTGEFDVLIHDDGEIGSNKTFELKLVPAGHTFDAAEPDLATVTIVDETAPPTIELAALDYEVSEGDLVAILTVRRTGDLSGSSRVYFTTVNGTALAPSLQVKGADYTTTSGTLVFRPRQNTTTIRVPIRDDNGVEPDETFRVELSNPSAGVVLGSNTSAEVVIHDNDPSVSFSKVTSSINEGARSPILALQRSEPSKASRALLS